MESTISSTTDRPRTARERVRVELTHEIMEVARRHLARDGSAALSLRAVARDVGMVSSAVYRYFPSRDDLLTALIIDAYAAVGGRATTAANAVRPHDFMGRWLAVCRATRQWAIEEPQQYALIFGSPVPGYAAPQDTIDPATIVPLLLIGIMVDAAAAGLLEVRHDPMAKAVHADLRQLRSAVAPSIDDHQLARGVVAWTMLIGAISFELFGHLHSVIFDHEPYFEHQMRTVGLDLGLVR